MTNTTYVIFDGDNDKWAYAYMRGWHKNKNIDFEFIDAHDLDSMTSRAQNEQYVKAQLKERMLNSDCVTVLVGESTKNLYKYVRWEIELAQELGLPIIVVNLNNLNRQDSKLCPALLRGTCCVHVPFKLAAIKQALDGWPSEYRRLTREEKNGGARYYKKFDEAD